MLMGVLSGGVLQSLGGGGRGRGSGRDGVAERLRVEVAHAHGTLHDADLDALRLAERGLERDRDIRVGVGGLGDHDRERVQQHGVAADHHGPVAGVLLAEGFLEREHGALRPLHQRRLDRRLGEVGGERHVQQALEGLVDDRLLLGAFGRDVERGQRDRGAPARVGDRGQGALRRGAHDHDHRVVVGQVLARRGSLGDPLVGELPGLVHRGLRGVAVAHEHQGVVLVGAEVGDDVDQGQRGRLHCGSSGLSAHPTRRGPRWLSKANKAPNSHLRPFQGTKHYHTPKIRKS